MCLLSHPVASPRSPPCSGARRCARSAHSRCCKLRAAHSGCCSSCSILRMRVSSDKSCSAGRVSRLAHLRGSARSAALTHQVLVANLHHQAGDDLRLHLRAGGTRVERAARAADAARVERATRRVPESSGSASAPSPPAPQSRPWPPQAPPGSAAAAAAARVSDSLSRLGFQAPASQPPGTGAQARGSPGCVWRCRVRPRRRREATGPGCRRACTRPRF